MSDTIFGWDNLLQEYIRYCNLNTNIYCSSTSSAYTPPTKINKKTIKLLYLNGVLT